MTSCTESTQTIRHFRNSANWKNDIQISRPNHPPLPQRQNTPASPSLVVSRARHADTTTANFHPRLTYQPCFSILPCGSRSAKVCSNFCMTNPVFSNRRVRCCTDRRWRGVLHPRDLDLLWFQSFSHWKPSFRDWRNSHNWPYQNHILLRQAHENQTDNIFLRRHHLDFVQALLHWVHCGRCGHSLTFRWLFGYHRAIFEKRSCFRRNIETPSRGAVREPSRWSRYSSRLSYAGAFEGTPFIQASHVGVSCYLFMPLRMSIKVAHSIDGTRPNLAARPSMIRST